MIYRIGVYSKKFLWEINYLTILQLDRFLSGELKNKVKSFSFFSISLFLQKGPLKISR